MSDRIATTPLTPATLQVLIALAAEPRHGYALMQEVEDATEGAVRLGAGTLYALLKRLLEQAWIVEVPAPPGETDERRRHYVATATGRQAARAELERMKRLLASPGVAPILEL